MKASSYNAFWTQGNLEKNIENYMHIPLLGNKNYYNSNMPIEIYNIEIGCKFVADCMNSKTSILMCSCRDYNVCHRKIVAKYMVDNYNCESLELEGS
jgi:hypothetical protein